eukprot:PhM_4_TR12478/c0_g1_i1/m.22655/K14407/CSTF2, RNA15; cleavage stimulation factor subunit 2
MEQKCCSVFFSGLLPTISEVDLLPLFREAGHVQSLRIRRDRETRSSLGFGFCEFMDHPSALAAVRILNGRLVEGKAMKLDMADNARAAREQMNQNRAHENGINLPGVNAVELALNNMPLEELYEAVSQLRALAKEQPDLATSLLTENPQLNLAVMHVMQHMNVLPQGQLPPEAFVAPSAVAAAASMADSTSNKHQQHQQHHHHPQSQSGGSGGGPSVELLQKIAGMSEAQLHKISSLTPEQLMALDPAHRQHIVSIQQYLRQMQGGML